MKALIVLFALVLAVHAEEFCFDNVKEACSQLRKTKEPITKCNAKYGAINDEAVVDSLQEYVRQHIIRSFEYLLLSTHYGNYEKNRKGFEKLFRELSDEKWEDSIELIQYITKRGGEMRLAPSEKKVQLPTKGQYELYELQSLAKALDIEKHLATEAHVIHARATHKGKSHHDPEISSHIENEFVHKQRDNIRKLSGYAADLEKIMGVPDSSIGLYLFDEYLQKQ